METLAQFSTLDHLKAALIVLPEGPSNIAQFTASLTNPEGEPISRANIYQVCNGTLKLGWLENEILSKIKECRIHYPAAFENKLREIAKPKTKAGAAS